MAEEKQFLISGEFLIAPGQFSQRDMTAEREMHEMPFGDFANIHEEVSVVFG